MVMCSTLMFVGATMFFAVYPHHTVVDSVGNYEEAVGQTAFVMFCSGWPLPTRFYPGEVIMFGDGDG